jgi:PKD repeat protein
MRKLFLAALLAACATQRVGTITVTANPTAVLVGQSVAFNCEATAAASPAFHWEFGDGAQSSVKSPTHVYERPGNYTAVCTVTDAEGARSSSVQITVAADTEPSVAIEADPSSGLAPLDVRFRAFAEGGNPPLTYEWAFGDGTHSAEREPAHTYTAAGAYRAELTLTDADGDAAHARITVSVGDTSTPAVSVTPATASGPAPLLVRFTCAATGGNPPYRYRWSFGDGTASDIKDPVYTYTRIGHYVATCTVTDRFEQAGQGVAEIEAEDPDRAPVIDGIAADNGHPGTEQLCAVAGQTRVRLAASVHDGNTPPAGLRFLWTFDEVPAGSRAAFERTDVTTTSFAPDLKGDYRARFWATNERGKTASSAVTIAAEGMGGVRFLNPEPAVQGDAGDAYPESLEVRTESPCGLPVAGGAVRWEVSNGRVVEADVLSAPTASPRRRSRSAARPGRPRRSSPTRWSASAWSSRTPTTGARSTASSPTCASPAAAPAPSTTAARARPSGPAAAAARRRATTRTTSAA